MDDDNPNYVRVHSRPHTNEIYNNRHLEIEVRTCSSSTSSRVSRTSKKVNTRSIGPKLRICQLNIEGISRDKSEFLARIARNNEVDVIVLQETHTANDTQLNARGIVQGYSLVDSVNSPFHGSAIFVKNDIHNFEKVCSEVKNGISVIVTKVCDIHIINIYKPPNVPWPENFTAHYQHPAVFIGDFNCHHQLWGYKDNNRDGISLVHWMELNNLHLVFDAKDRKTFNSARWRQGYTPDLCFTTTNNDFEPLPSSRMVLNDFPHSQHRPVLISIGIEISPIPTLAKPRWNFQKANWEEFKKKVDSNLRWVKPIPNNYHRFLGVLKGAAKTTIPRGYRKDYIPCWSTNIENLYNTYKENPTQDLANEILTALNKSRKDKWNNLMENMNFTHSSRSSWSLLRKLGTTNEAKEERPTISPNLIASRLVNVSNSVKVEKKEIKEIKNLVRHQRKRTTTSTDLSQPFTMVELKTALNKMKSGKAAGFDGIYPEFLKHLGSLALNWILSFFNDILITGHIPTEFRKAKVIAILKPGKPADAASSYRPISLLSVTYKLLERLIYQRIRTSVENMLPREQAGFREGRNCCDQVLALSTNIEAGFQRHQKTGVAFVDLTAAYDTVWKDGLLYKLYNAIPCGHVVKLIESMLSNRMFRVFVGDKSSKFRRLNNGLPQGSVLAPLLFNLYTSDLPPTISRKFIYADDLALSFQHKQFETIEKTLSKDLTTMNTYFKKWRLCPNPSKTEVTCFHLDNHKKNQKLEVFLMALQLDIIFNPLTSVSPWIHT